MYKLLFFQRFFGVVRSFGGNEDHPTVTNFGQVFRLLSLHTPLKLATRGNCTGSADPVLISLEETLSSRKMAALLEKETRKEKLESLLRSITLEEQPVSALDHGYSRPTARDTVLYYLGGYVVKKASKFSGCADCLATITDTQNVPAAAVLTEMRSFVPGALKHPSRSLTNLLAGIESVVESETKGERVFGNLFWSIVDILTSHALPQLGCSLHFEQFTVQVIKFYLIMRMHFYTRFLAERSRVSEKVKNARKKSRLL